MNTDQNQVLGLKEAKAQTKPADRPSLTCERCGNKTDAGAWLGFVYVGAECLTQLDNEYLE